jgi:short-subunit dehydrogenase
MLLNMTRSMQDARLKSKVALVTGASGAIGRSIVHALCHEGAHVALLARNVDGLARLQQELAQYATRTAVISADVTLPQERRAAFEQVEAELGPIDILVNNAAIESAGPFPQLDEATIDYTVALNVTAALQLTRLVIDGMLARRYGHVVNMSSLAGKKGAAYDAVYSATKAALVEFTSGMSAELAGTGVNVSVICPGYVSGEGMFARLNVAPPLVMGTVTAEKVAQATVRAILHNQLEVIVNAGPVRPLLALNAFSPRMVNWLLRVLGVTAVQRRKVGLDG